MTNHAPLAQVKGSVGSKKDLIEKVRALATEKFWIDRTSHPRALERLSNTKLLRLHRVFTDASKRFASRAEVIDAIARAENHARDVDFKKALERHPLPRLMDMLQSAERRARRAAKTATAAKPAKTATAAKPAKTATAAKA